MKLFECSHCHSPIYFENSHCIACGHTVGYDPSAGTMVTLEPLDGAWRALGGEQKGLLLFCDNAVDGACNWLLPADSDDTLCPACRHNRTLPDLSDPANAERWRRIETAKHYLFYGLLRLGLQHPTRQDDPEEGLAFDFVADVVDAQGNVQRVLTGHDHGLITLNIAEADDAVREERRHAMGEPYRTLLGHFRHEIAHYYWDRLVRDGPMLEECRRVFGDEREDYGAALQRHYSDGPPADWQVNFVSAYATSHPWEDFAETWAHYMHIVDTLETARSFGLTINPRIAGGEQLKAAIAFDPYRSASIEPLMKTWPSVTVAVNALNRSMGQPDVYPFVLSGPIEEKLGFIHALVRASAPRAGTRTAAPASA